MLNLIRPVDTSIVKFILIWKWLELNDMAKYFRSSYPEGWGKILYEKEKVLMSIDNILGVHFNKLK